MATSDEYFEAAKESSSVSDPGSGPEESSSLSEPYGFSSGSSGSSGSSSSSCDCDFVVDFITLEPDGPNSGSFEIENLGTCEITDITVTGTLTPSLVLVVPATIEGGGSATVAVYYAEDIRGTTFTVHTSCGESTHEWPVG